MSEQQGDAWRPPLPPPQASGIVRRSELRPRTPRRGSAVGWPVFVVGLVIGAVAVAWLLERPSAPSIVGATASPRVVALASPSATTNPRGGSEPTSGPSAEPTVAATPEPTPQPTAAPTLTPTPTPGPTLEPTPAPTLELTPEPSPPTAFTIVFPTDGEVLHDQQLNVIGTGPAGATVTRDIPMWFDDHITVQRDGTWLMPVSLGAGNNTLRFRIGNDRSTEWAINVVYVPRS